MKAVSILLFLLCAAAYSQTITYQLDAATQAGLEVVTAQHPAFRARLAGVQSHPQSSARRLGEFAPLVVILRNATSEPIDSVVVKYEYHFLDGTVSSGPMSLAANPFNAGQFAPGQTMTFFPFVRRFGDGAAIAQDGDADKVRALMARCASIVVSVDSVTFADGRRIGADSMGSGVQRAAMAKAITDTQAELQSLGGDLDKIKAYGEGLARTHLPTPTSSETALRDSGAQYARYRAFIGQVLQAQPDRAHERLRQLGDAARRAQ